MTDAAEIARGLSEAQKKMLIGIRDWPRDGKVITNWDGLDRRSRKVLQRKELIAMVGGKNCFFGAVPTSLGLVVREHLKGQQP